MFVPTQQTRVKLLIPEAPICCGATEPDHSSSACTPEPGIRNSVPLGAPFADPKLKEPLFPNVSSCLCDCPLGLSYSLSSHVQFLCSLQDLYFSMKLSLGWNVSQSLANPHLCVCHRTCHICLLCGYVRISIKKSSSLQAGGHVFILCFIKADLKDLYKLHHSLCA